MRGHNGLGLALAVCAWSLLVQGCGAGLEGPLPCDAPEDTAARCEGPALELGATSPSGPLEVAPALELHRVDAERPSPPAPPFLPAFHQALRWSHSEAELTTFRLFLQVGRAGERLRVTFRSGDGALTLQRASVATVGPDGALTSTPVPLSFSGAPGVSVGQRTRVTSDAVALPVRQGEELAVTFEVRGALALSAIDSFPRSTRRPGAHALGTGALGGTRFERSLGVATVEVQGPPSRVFLALGDSITEGYYDTFNDFRRAWPSLAQAQLGVPVLNAGVSGQGFWGALLHLDEEVLALRGVTDCVVLLGTNDLSALSDAELQARMTRLLDRLRPFCRLWVSTLLPKEKSNHGDYTQVKAGRLVFNDWLRQLPGVTLIDLEAVTRSPADVHLFLPGLEVDGIHPSPEGHRVIADEVVRVVRERWQAPAPAP